MKADPQTLLLIHLGNSILKQISDEVEKQQLKEEIEKLKEQLNNQVK
jgi:cell division protein FtsB